MRSAPAGRAGMTLRQIMVSAYWGGTGLMARRRTVELMPSAPTTRSYSPADPSAKVTDTRWPCWARPVSATPRRHGTPAAASRISCSRIRVIARQGPTSRHRSARSVSHSRLPCWSKNPQRGSGTEVASMASPTPRAPSARTALACKTIPAPTAGQTGLRSTSSGAAPVRRRAMARDNPAIPPPTMRMRPASAMSVPARCGADGRRHPGAERVRACAGRRGHGCLTSVTSPDARDPASNVASSLSAGGS